MRGVEISPKIARAQRKINVLREARKIPASGGVLRKYLNWRKSGMRTDSLTIDTAQIKVIFASMFLGFCKKLVSPVQISKY